MMYIRRTLEPPMNLPRAALWLFFAAGCPAESKDTAGETGTSDSGVDTGSGDTADTGETGDTETGDTETGDTETGDTETGDTDTASGCSTVNSGEDWAWTGACPQMTTPVVIAVKGCELSLDYDADGGMTMGMPYSGTVSGDVVTFADDNSVDGCVGTVDSADKITGSCKGGCTFTLRR